MNPKALAALRAWLKKRDVSPNAFALRNDLDQSDFSKLLRGKKERISVAQAAKIEAGTLGEIEIASWAPDEKSAGAR